MLLSRQLPNILKRKSSTFEFLWETNPLVLKCLWEKGGTKDDGINIVSPIFEDNIAKTQWNSKLCLFDDDNSVNTTQTKLYVELMNISFKIKSFMCLGKAICLQNSQTSEFKGIYHNSCNLKKSMTFNTNELQKYEKLSFHIFIEFVKITYGLYFFLKKGVLSVCHTNYAKLRKKKT